EEGIFLVGSTQSIGNGSFDMLLMKIDHQGDSLFSYAFGEEYYEHGRSILYSDDRLYIGGQKRADSEANSSAIYMVCVDLDANLIWERTIESSKSDKLKDMVLSTDGTAIYCLAQSEYEDTKKDFWLFTLDTSGQFFSVTDLNISSSQVYPNPVISQANIDMDGYTSANCELQIFNGLGQLVLTKEGVISSQVYSFETTSLASGFYTYLLHIGNKKRMTGKFIVH
ncbi:MAG: T9SS type A sorting domain-containing protein, partial [Bacteroidales bacterium]|nr:T9SS type A sorting domain-containing protein [Bacteroidales bacterium]